ncbi:MAG: hypothetical protein AVDCRST_MAG90-1889 [uncultured Microvirga sp.]|uniref:Uncharacterized protein n=1 Tax=uncultured Microvirga sp. TaxID=412392 RepID=A0A6J4LQW3_9HYPH|nr:MAG: hypothetical protein AVDCRST_MAG90-1889 [uncultured Microvirga sp.]
MSPTAPVAAAFGWVRKAKVRASGLSAILAPNFPRRRSFARASSMAE